MDVKPRSPHLLLNLLSLTTMNITSPSSLRDLAALSASQSVVELKLKRTGTRYMVKELNSPFLELLYSLNSVSFVMQVKTIFLPTEKDMTSETCAPLIANLPLEVSHIPYP